MANEEVKPLDTEEQEPTLIESESPQEVRGVPPQFDQQFSSFSLRPVVEPHHTKWNTIAGVGGATVTAKYAKPQNFDGIIIEYTSPGDSEVGIPHHLGRTPSLVQVMTPDGGVTFHQSTAADGANIYLTASADVADVTVKILVF